MWTIAGLAAVALGYQRFRQAIGNGQPDLGQYFLPAARAILAGDSPYEVVGYFYTPLVALLMAPFAESPWAVEYWTVLRILCGIASCVLAGLAFSRPGEWLRAGFITLVAVVTLLWSWPATVSLWLGQVELLVLLALLGSVYFEARGRPILAGFALGAAALVKTWPALFALWLLRSGWRTRGRQWIGLAAAGALAIVMAMVVAGPSGVLSMLQGPLSGADQPLAANSVWGVTRVMFSGSSIAEPLVEAPLARWTIAVVLMMWVLALLVVTLMRPGSASIALFNTVFTVILLLPVSHFFYAILALPALWWWFGQLMRTPRDPRVWIPVSALGVWWVVVFRITPDGDGLASTTWGSVALMFGASLLAATVSVVCAARRSGDASVQRTT